MLQGLLIYLVIDLILSAVVITLLFKRRHVLRSLTRQWLGLGELDLKVNHLREQGEAMKQVLLAVAGAESQSDHHQSFGFNSELNEILPFSNKRSGYDS